MDKKLIFLDTESTGLDTEDRICQVAYKIDSDIYDELFKPELDIKVSAMAVTHITNKMVADKPVFVGSEMHKHLETLFAGGDILVAHNVAFDLGMLQKEGLDTKNIICTKKVAMELDKGAVIESYSLQYLRYLLGFEIEAQAHDALGDILVLEKLFESLLKKMIEDTGGEEKAIEKMLEISSKPTLFKKFPFGKFKGKRIEEADAGYLQWLLKEKKTNEPDDIDWIYTLEHHLGSK